MTMSTHDGNARDDSAAEASPTRVLLIEDDAVDRKMVQRALDRSEGDFAVTACDDLASALAAADENTFDCALVDYRLPDGTALDFLNAIADDAEPLPVVVLTGLNDEATALEILQHGAQDYLTKDTVDPVQLRRAVRYAIERARVLVMQQQLQHRDRLAAVGQLAAGVAHEVNNPLTFLLLNTELVQSHLTTVADAIVALRRKASEGALDSTALESSLPAVATEALLVECQAVCAENLDGLQRIHRIVGDLRFFARPGNDPIESVDVAAVLRSACSLVTNEVRHRAQLELDLQPVPAIAGDRAQLAQLFTNLLLNAAQAIGEGDADRNRIVVRCQRNDEGITASIEDTGAGIDIAHQSRIFEPFFTTKASDDGSGLGLSLSLEIARKHGGDIRVQSESDVGTTMTVVLPLVTGLEIEPQDPPVPATVPSRRARILVVDDEPVICRLYERIMGMDHEVVVALSGKHAIEHLELDPNFDIVFCDIMMPDVDGPALYEIAQARWPALCDQFVFVSGGAFTDRARAFANEIGHPLIEKPFDQRDLLDALAEALKH